MRNSVRGGENAPPKRWQGQRLWSELGLLGLVGVLLWSYADDLSAQTRRATVQLTIPEILPVTKNETVFPVQLDPSGSVKENDFLLIAGLPQTVTLSEGQRFSSGIWGIKVAKLPSATIVAEGKNYGESSTLDVTLKALDGQVLARAQSHLLIMPTVETANTSSQATAGVPRVRSETIRRKKLTPRTFTPEEKKAILLLMKKGGENMRDGKINIARLFYKKAAKKGWPDGAIALARTYDATELRKMNAFGIDPDDQMAEQWYRHARKLGSELADNYLKRLASGGVGQ